MANNVKRSVLSITVDVTMQGGRCLAVAQAVRHAGTHDESSVMESRSVSFTGVSRTDMSALVRGLLDAFDNASIDNSRVGLGGAKAVIEKVRNQQTRAAKPTRAAKKPTRAAKKPKQPKQHLQDAGAGNVRLKSDGTVDRRLTWRDDLAKHLKKAKKLRTSKLKQPKTRSSKKTVPDNAVETGTSTFPVIFPESVPLPFPVEAPIASKQVKERKKRAPKAPIPVVVVDPNGTATKTVQQALEGKE